jgi:hypothetical protein
MEEYNDPGFVWAMLQDYESREHLITTAKALGLTDPEIRRLARNKFSAPLDQIMIFRECNGR